MAAVLAGLLLLGGVLFALSQAGVLKLFGSPAPTGPVIGADACGPNQQGTLSANGNQRTFTWTATQEFTPGNFCMMATSTTYGSGFSFQGDGNLVWVMGGKPLWEAKSAGKAAKLVFQADGSVVLLDAAGKRLWVSTDGVTAPWQTTEADQKAIIVEAINETSRDGTIERRHAARQVNSPAAAGGRAIATGLNFAAEEPTPLCRTGVRVVGVLQSFAPGELCLKRDATTLNFQPDGNLVLYANGNVAWSSKTAGTDLKLTIQSDGNIVIAGKDGTPAWSLAKELTSTWKGLSGPAVEGGLELTTDSSGAPHKLRIYTDTFLVGGNTGNSVTVG